MQTDFSPDQLATPRIKLADDILRKCVHCGFCTATCPTYVLLGDELDSPRGRIYQIKEMFEGGQKAEAETTKHLDRCLTCLSCMTTCPSGVHYMHLVDEARAHVEETYKRPVSDRLMRSVLAFVLPYPKRFAFALRAARLAKPFAGLFSFLKPVKAMLALVPSRLDRPGPLARPGVHAPDQKPTGRVALLTGCANSVLEPSINEATVRVLNRAGVEVVIPPSAGCCGAMEHHLGREHATLEKVKANVNAWMAEIEGEGLDAIIINASGCGTTVKDYGHMLRLEEEYASKAKTVSALARDITEYLSDIEVADFTNPKPMRVTYHSACSMQHGQKIRTLPKQLLTKAGFEVGDVPEGHLCCGSAGVYNILQSEIADKLKSRKLANIAKTTPQIIAAGNIGCITQLASGTNVPVIHTIELLDWAQGGPKPAKL
ncbi:MAG TPA: glycolate oxidase subunit GlcF [Rhizobiales bacterium]|nr:glycolate oxidase subunit GlcF [Hyphomicrobiales bacterium]